jgi:Xaa-Pro aminopeptidase
MNAQRNSRTLLVIGAPEHDASAYHLSGFLAPDPVISLQTPGGKYLAVSSLEYGRAEKAAGVDELVSFEELEVNRLSRELKSGARGLAAAAAKLVERAGAAGSLISVPPDMGVVYADELRARGLQIEPDGELFAQRRRVKTGTEISHIQSAQKSVEVACSLAVEVLKESEAAEDGTLVWRGEVLTSELLRAEIDVALLRRGCVADGTIVACGPQAADPHERGSGPLVANKSIIVDIFPFDARTRYYADMTRTFVKGEPDAELSKMYNAVLESQEAALAMIGPGVNGKDVHQKVSDVLHERGYKTFLHDREEGRPLTVGFFHGTGHGVGLEIHEGPRLSTTDEELVPGDVVTVEPGLYDPEIGGVRIEDLVVVTRNGCRNLTEFPKEFRV